MADDQAPLQRQIPGLPRPAEPISAIKAQQLRQLLSNLVKWHHLDDTPNRILNQGTILKPDRRSGQLKPRSGTFTSGLIATLESGQQIVLYQTDIGHAGELIDEILRLRHSGLAKPTIMCDALSRNLPTVLDETQRHDTFCNSHCRRGFVDVAELHPDKVPWVLALYDPVWHHDAHCKKEKYTPAERLAYHQQHSLPLMAQLKQWGEAQIESGDTEPTASPSLCLSLSGRLRGRHAMVA
ncbi:hypothetical protein D5085_14120 [Ectothiorhodospiraceae bacterium BW-2]|nr:hypothetical protein D5085_14120 [Ectothiorhodospiraceae bacterium BW-2]